MREEELFTELQNALHRARTERRKQDPKTSASGATERDPSESPSKSPQGSGFKGVKTGEEKEKEREETPPGSPTGHLDGGGFFENELRGYRLLKAAKLSAAERQHVMTLTKNATHFHLIRQALRSDRKVLER